MATMATIQSGPITRERVKAQYSIGIIHHHCITDDCSRVHGLIMHESLQSVAIRELILLYFLFQ